MRKQDGLGTFGGEFVDSFVVYPYAFYEVVSFQRVEEWVDGAAAYEEAMFVVDVGYDVVSAFGSVWVLPWLWCLSFLIMRSCIFLTIRVSDFSPFTVMVNATIVYASLPVL